MAVAAMGLSGPEPAKDAPKLRIKCEIQVIWAKHGKKHIDDDLKPIAHYLRNSFGNRYERFELHSQGGFTLEKRRSGVQKLPNDSRLKLTFLGVEKALLRLTMEVSGLKTTVKIHDGGLFFQAGRKYRGGMLVVAIRVRKLAK